MNIKEYLQQHRLITDGAMGTYYEKKYQNHTEASEYANTKYPERILDIHLEYMRAGAKLIRTNTFASNTLLFDNVEQVQENIRAGFAIAQQARERYLQELGRQEDIYIAADIGPVYAAGLEEEKQALEEYQAICDAFLSCGAEIFLFETQTDFAELGRAAAYVREKAPEAFVAAQFAFDKSGYTRSGISLGRIVEMAEGCRELDAYGFNCGVGAAHMYQLLKNTAFSGDKYVSALPNAGYPVSLRGKTIYADNEAYFVKMGCEIAQLGIDIQGGCCGTTPDYIHRLSEALSKKERGQKNRIGEREQQTLQNRSEKDAAVYQAGMQNAVRREQDLPQGAGMEQNDFRRKLLAGEKVYVVELDPPFKNDISKVMDGAKLVKEAGADMIDLADSPMARARMDAGALAARIQREIGIPAMPHLCCRDKNLIALRSAIMGNYMNGIRQMLFITGDPVERDARNRISSVFDVNSIRLMQYMQEMNIELYEDEPVFYGGALNYHGANPDAILQRMYRKKEAGCSYFMTQPIYAPEDIERIRWLKERIDTKILCGIMPLVSYKNAMFIHNEMPGIQIPEDIRSRYRPEMTREEAQETAVEISVKIINHLEDLADGYYFMTPFNRAGLIVEILRKGRRRLK